MRALNCEGIKIRIIIKVGNDSFLTLYLLPRNHKVGVNPTIAPKRIVGLKFLTTKCCQTLKCFTRIKSVDNRTSKKTITTVIHEDIKAIICPRIHTFKVGKQGFDSASYQR